MTVNKVVRLGDIEVYKGKRADVFCKIQFADGKLSISGVEGPKPNGDAWGSCGQIDMHLRDRQDEMGISSSWTREMLARFFDVWGKWHLNHLTAGSPAQEAELAKHKFPGYPKEHYTWALKTLAQAGPFTVWCYDDLTEEEDAQFWAAALTNKRFKRSPKVLATSKTFDTQEAAIEYARPIASGREAEIRGLECDNGYKYGSAWLRKEVPQDVVEFLAGLPDTDVQPAWV